NDAPFHNVSFSRVSRPCACHLWGISRIRNALSNFVEPIGKSSRFEKKLDSTRSIANGPICHLSQRSSIPSNSFSFARADHPSEPSRKNLDASSSEQKTESPGGRSVTCALT